MASDTRRVPEPCPNGNPEDTDALTCTETLEADVAEPTAEVVRRANTFDSFRFRDFTWFWLGSLVSNTGTWMQTSALGIVVWGLRGRESDLGLVNFATGIPILFLALPAGVLADRVDKRRLLILSQLLLGIQAASLWALYRTGQLTPEKATSAIMWIAGLGLASGVLSALTYPAWQAFLPDLVPKKALMNAIALNSAQFQSSRMLGPVIAGALVAAGITSGDVFLVNAASFLFVIASLFAISPCDSACRGEDLDERPKREKPLAALTAGLRFARERSTIGALLISTAVMTVLAMPYMMLLPSIAAKTFGNEEIAYWLQAANGLGAIVGSLVVASLPSNIRRERVIPISLTLQSLLLIAFSFSRVLWLSVALSAFAGAMFLTTNSLTNTSIQASAPGRLRGRVMALFVLAFMGMMPVSAAIFGPVGQAMGPMRAVLISASLLLGWALFLGVTGKLHKGAAE